jgi:hypothetical protein
MQEMNMTLATPRDAMLEQARNEGAEDPTLTFFDTWEQNPYYQGPPVPHPESEFSEYLEDMRILSNIRNGPPDYDDIPF